MYNILYLLFIAQRNQVAAEADEVLRPLMDLLDGKWINKYTLFHNFQERKHKNDWLNFT
jgi:hypothetical protein